MGIAIENIHDSKGTHLTLSCIKETGVVVIHDYYKGPVVAMSLKKAEMLAVELTELCKKVREG